MTLHNALLAGGVVALATAVLERLVARGADAVLGVSADLEERMPELGARARARAPWCRLRLRAPRRGPRQRSGPRSGAAGPLLVSVARLAEQKGLPVLLDAPALLRRAPPDAVLAARRRRPAARRAPGADRRASGLPVRLLGRRDDVADLLAAADLVIVPSAGRASRWSCRRRCGPAPRSWRRTPAAPPRSSADAAVLVPARRRRALAAAVAGAARRPRPARRTVREPRRQRAAELPTERGRGRAGRGAVRRSAADGPRAVSRQPVDGLVFPPHTGATRGSRPSASLVQPAATTKHIFVTGGVASSLGKGLTASSLGHLLRARGLRVTMQKLDPYLNVDPAR